MSIIEAIILGIVQGLTEFLPVSSSGHLVLTQKILGINGNILFFDTMLHVGTLAAVFIVFWPDIKEIFKDLFGRFTWLLVVATIPAVIVGFITTSILLVLSELLYKRKAPKYLTKKSITFPVAIEVGCMQAFAMLPGVSRSGSTLAGSLSCRMERNLATRFISLMSIPVILGSGLKQGYDLVKDGAGEIYLIPTIIGMLVAAVVGYIAGKLLISIVKKHKLYGFAAYTCILGILVILDQLVFHLVF
jgi:undecaprenyl-diphosphatase